MPDAARNDEVVEIVDYLRETISKADTAIRDMQAHRNELALRLAVIQAATSNDVRAALEDHDERVASNRPYEDAESAEKLLSEAHNRFVR